MCNKVLGFVSKGFVSKVDDKKASKLLKKQIRKSAKKAVKLDIQLNRKKSDNTGILGLSKPKELLEVCLILDCTGSMWQWIQRSKETLSTIIDQVVNENKDLTVRVSFVGYRDIGEHNRFSVINFTEKVSDVQKFIATQEAEGGGDAAEDVQGAFHQASILDWTPRSAKQIFHICDAPGHGKDICEYRVLDFYREGGSPEGLKIQDQME